MNFHVPDNTIGDLAKGEAMRAVDLVAGVPPLKWNGWVRYKVEIFEVTYGLTMPINPPRHRVCGSTKSDVVPASEREPGYLVRYWFIGSSHHCVPRAREVLTRTISTILVALH